MTLAQSTQGVLPGQQSTVGGSASFTMAWVLTLRTFPLPRIDRPTPNSGCRFDQPGDRKAGRQLPRGGSQWLARAALFATLALGCHVGWGRRLNVL